MRLWFFFFFQAEDGIRDIGVTGVQTCALPISLGEMAEMALSLRAHQGVEREQGSYAELTRRLGRDGVAVPRTLCLEAGCAYDDDRPLQWLPMKIGRAHV